MFFEVGKSVFLFILYLGPSCEINCQGKCINLSEDCPAGYVFGDSDTCTCPTDQGCCVELIGELKYFFAPKHSKIVTT